MPIIVKKFGGSSLSDNEKLKHVANIIKKDYLEGNDVVVVVSAQGNTTDLLIDKINSVSNNFYKREADVILSTGEMLSMSLLTSVIKDLNLPCISLTGWQSGFFTDSNHTFAKIKYIDTSRIENELQKKNIVIISGFQGVNKYGDITTLGRGGSDTSAVALASSLKADKCQIYTDVDGVFSCDPRLIKNVKHIEKIDYDEMLEFSSSGAKVLHNRSIEIAKKYNVTVEVLSTFDSKKSTIVKEVSELEKLLISGISKDEYISMITLVGVNAFESIDFKLFSILSKNKIKIDLITQSIINNNKKDITFTVSKDNLKNALKCIEENKQIFNYENMVFDDDVAKLSIIGSGIASDMDIFARIFSLLNHPIFIIKMICTSEIKISIIINKKNIDAALSVLHSEFFN